MSNYDNIDRIEYPYNILVVPHVVTTTNRHTGSNTKDFDKLILQNAYPAYYRNSDKDVCKITLSLADMMIDADNNTDDVPSYSYYYKSTTAITMAEKISIMSILGTANIAVSLLRYSINIGSLYRLGKEAMLKHDRNIDISFIKRDAIRKGYIVVDIPIFIAKYDKYKTTWEVLRQIHDINRYTIAHIVMKEIYKIYNSFSENELYFVNTEIDKRFGIRYSIFMFAYPIAIKFKYESGVVTTMELSKIKTT